MFPGLEVGLADDIGFQHIELAVMPSLTSFLKLGARIMVGEDFSPVVSGVKKLEIEFLDGHLTSVQFEFDDTVKWNSLDEFAEKVGAMLGLSGVWARASRTYKEVKRIDAPQFRVEIGKGVWGPELRLQDVGAERIVAERTAAREAHQRQTFRL
jgi:hypothetical protein